MKRMLTCNHCALLFEGKRQNERKHIFCSNECYNTYRRVNKDDPDKAMGYVLKLKDIPVLEPEYGIDLLAVFKQMKEKHG